MKHQKLVDCCSMPCAVLSVERLEDESCGRIRIVCANQPYKDVMGPRYRDNMPYEELVPKDAKFEDFCFRAAFMGKRMHAYVRTKAFDVWIDQDIIPLNPKDESLGYCQFVCEFTGTAEPERMASVSVNTASAIVKASLRLSGAQDFVGAVGDVLEDVLWQCDAFGSRIMLVDEERKIATKFCARIRGNPNEEEMPGDGIIPYETVRSWEAMIGVSNAIIVKDERDMAFYELYNAEWVRSMREHGVRTLVLIPLRQGGETFGYLYVTNFDKNRVVETKELVELMAFVLASQIYNYLLMQRLEELSQVDGLTGLFNRNAMIRRIKQLEQSQGIVPFGVVNMDLNGLKLVNDRQGHDAGDRLLVSAAEALQKVFYVNDLYRTGGDEFIVLSTGIERRVFERKVERLRYVVRKDSSVSSAIGSCWSDGTLDVRAVFRRADKDMYADKSAFYERNPELRR